MRDPILQWLAMAALAFGLVSVASGGRALFGSQEMKAAAGHAVPFVLWFNFLSGFLYILAAAGLLAHDIRAVYVSLFIAAATLLVFGAFGAHALGGGAYERRPVGALTVRSLFWVAVATVACRTNRTPQALETADAGPGRRSQSPPTDRARGKSGVTAADHGQSRGDFHRPTTSAANPDRYDRGSGPRLG